ncbi:MAG: helix-turn-helix domain-containing protein [Acidimicrobiales bacterium]
MGPGDQDVKGDRRYDATRRRDRARRQYEATLAIARSRFLEDGYGGVTVESIAEAAEVSAATVYKSYGGKAGLARTLCEHALRGDGSVPAEERSDQLQRTGDARAIIEGWGRLAAEVSPSVSPLLLLLRDAAQTDGDAAALLEELEASHLARMTDNARRLLATGNVRPGMTTSAVRDVLWTCTAPELYDLLIARRRWSRPQFARFVADTMKGCLL